MSDEGRDTVPAGHGQEPPDQEAIDAALSDRVREEYSAKALAGDERRRALQEHRHHLVRDTTSQITIHPDVGPGMEADVTVEVPDTYCFTCEEWVGLSGLDLTGTPRSRADAYYLRGAPDAVRDLRQEVRDDVTDLAEAIIDRHPAIETPQQAAEFIMTQIEQIQDRLVMDQSTGTGGAISNA